VCARGVAKNVASIRVPAVALTQKSNMRLRIAFPSMLVDAQRVSSLAWSFMREQGENHERQTNRNAKQAIRVQSFGWTNWYETQADNAPLPYPYDTSDAPIAP
jgi:hypothetical protein